MQHLTNVQIADVMKLASKAHTHMSQLNYEVWMQLSAEAEPRPTQLIQRFFRRVFGCAMPLLLTPEASILRLTNDLGSWI